MTMLDSGLLFGPSCIEHAVVNIQLKIVSAREVQMR